MVNIDTPEGTSLKNYVQKYNYTSKNMRKKSQRNFLNDVKVRKNLSSRTEKNETVLKHLMSIAFEQQQQRQQWAHTRKWLLRDGNAEVISPRV